MTACVPVEFVGWGQSNARVVVDSTEPRRLLDIPLPPDLGTRREGLAAVHITAAPLNPNGAIPANANTKLIVNFRWQAGSGGGEIDVDGDHGMIFSVGAATSIVATARLESAQYAVAPLIGTTYSVEATVKWQTGGQPGPAQLTLGAMTLNEDGSSGVWIRFPKQARTFTLMCNNNGGYGTLVGEYSRDAVGIAVETLTAPRQEPIPAGVTHFRIRGRAGDIVTPVFQLWTG